MQGQEDPRRNQVPPGQQRQGAQRQTGAQPQRQSAPPQRQSAQQRPQQPAGQQRVSAQQRSQQPPRAQQQRPPQQRQAQQRPPAQPQRATPPRDAQRRQGGGGEPPRRRKRSENRWFRAIVMVLATIGFCIFLAIFALQSANDLLGFNQPDEQIAVTIPEGATISSVSRILKESGVIDQPFVFRLYIGFKSEDGEMNPGDYVLNTNMGYDEILVQLRSGDTYKPVVTLTFYEGWTIKDAAEELENEGVCDAQEFIDYLNSADYDYEFFNALEDNPLRYHLLEGYIFPDTYEFYINENVESVARKFVRRFNEMVMTTEYLARMQDLNMTVDETLTLASIIQREAGDSDDMRLVSSVFHNRLNSTMYPSLQSDVTVLYVENNIKPYIQHQNQDMYDAYNSYVCVGLPVGPICNPGIDAIEAALYPENTSFYFFVTDENGDFYYAADAASHYNNVAIAMQEGEVHGIDTQ